LLLLFFILSLHFSIESPRYSPLVTAAVYFRLYASFLNIEFPLDLVGLSVVFEFILWFMIWLVLYIFYELPGLDFLRVCACLLLLDSLNYFFWLKRLFRSLCYYYYFLVLLFFYVVSKSTLVSAIFVIKFTGLLV